MTDDMLAAASDTVRVTRHGEIGIVTIDNPPVNALSAPVRRGLLKAIETLNADPSVAALVVAGAGRTFVAGADITEFGKPRQPPELREILARLEVGPKPVVAAIHGSALGGGLELALACHYRIADTAAKLGLPEVRLGLIPGAGGTVRLPRMIGPEKAMRLIVSGSPVTAAKATEDGLIDAAVEGDLVAHAIAFARKALTRGGPWPVARDRDHRLARFDAAAFEAKAAALTRKARGLEAPVAGVQAVRNAVALPFDEALAEERAIFERLAAGDQSRALRHLFFAEREAAKVPGVGKDVRPREVARVGVIGSGVMGGGIAMACANAGLPVVLLDVNRKALDLGLAAIDRNYAVSVSRGSTSEDEKTERRARIAGSVDYADLADCDLIVEAVFEDMAIKKDVFAALHRVARPGAILATNTSYLDVDEIAGSISRPSDVLGLHFFSPANVMKLLEIVRGRETAPEVLATAVAVAQRIGKTAVVVGVCHGFVGNRMLSARGAENEALLLEGASPEQVDRVFTDFGWPMGPFQMGDMAGLDIGWRNRKALGRTSPIVDALCEQGRFGQKTGRGFYLYEQGSRTPRPDPDVARLIAEKARECGVERREISDREILERTLQPMIEEGRKILEEGIAARESDIDLVWVHGYGFPAGKGGPMFWARQQGLV